ncbi:TM2 domain-containing protein [Marixanthomonas sp. SCSIO 43207]|uniref:TM2 domain-containing protein n=1 Tax=Marixanthomonas sp. SCSIO 43207 TaxID=2779360 RepID=UPI001CA82A49|nr:TM2 domain-containing protein [Marixanthomonas sp. SCSIO 43207]
MEENKNEGYDSTKKRMDDTAENIENEAKSTANEFKEGWNQATNSGDNKKLMAGILAIILGSLGIHKFILGYNKEGIILLVATLIGYATSCLGVGFFILMATGVVGLIEGIIYLTKSDEEFYNTYQVGQKPWF